MLSIISLLFCLPALVFHRAPRRTPILRIYILSVRLQSRICRMEACARARCCKNLTIFIVYPFLCCDISTVCRLMVHHHFRLKENKKHTRKRVNCFFCVCILSYHMDLGTMALYYFKYHHIISRDKKK